MPRGVYPRKPLSEERKAQIQATAIARGYGKWMTGKKLAPETCQKRRLACLQRKTKYGYYHTPAGLQKMSDASKHRPRQPRPTASILRKDCPICGLSFVIRPNYKPQIFCSRHCFALSRRMVVGEKASNWQGGKSLALQTERHIAMSRAEYRQWRQAVFTRDDYTCQSCGARGGKLNADHIETWASAPHQRYAVENGRTMCVPCHKARHSRCQQA